MWACEIGDPGLPSGLWAHAPVPDLHLHPIYTCVRPTGAPTGSAFSLPPCPSGAHSTRSVPLVPFPAWHHWAAGGQMRTWWGLLSSPKFPPGTGGAQECHWGEMLIKALCKCLLVDGQSWSNSNFKVQSFWSQFNLQNLLFRFQAVTFKGLVINGQLTQLNDPSRLQTCLIKLSLPLYTGLANLTYSISFFKHFPCLTWHAKLSKVLKPLWKKKNLI